MLNGGTFGGGGQVVMEIGPREKSEMHNKIGGEGWYLFQPNARRGELINFLMNLVQ